MIVIKDRDEMMRSGSAGSLNETISVYLEGNISKLVRLARKYDVRIIKNQGSWLDTAGSMGDMEEFLRDAAEQELIYKTVINRKEANAAFDKKTLDYLFDKASMRLSD